MRPHRAAPLFSRFLAPALAGLLLAGCTDPFDSFGRIVSLPWGVQLNRPEGTQIVHDKGAMYLYPAKEGWSLVLSARRLPLDAPAARELGPEAARALMEEARRAAAPRVRIVEWRIRPFGLSRALWIRFEGPPGRGQAGIPEPWLSMCRCREKTARCWRWGPFLIIWLKIHHRRKIRRTGIIREFLMKWPETALF